MYSIASLPGEHDRESNPSPLTVCGRSVHFRTAATDLKTKSCEAESHEQCRRQQEWRAPGLEGAVALYGDGQGRGHGSPYDKFDDAEDQRQQSTTTIVCTTEHEECRAREDRGGQREHQPHSEECSVQLGVGRSAGNGHDPGENECRPTYQQVAKADHAPCGDPGPPVGSHEPWKHSTTVASMSTGTQHLAHRHFGYGQGRRGRTKSVRAECGGFGTTFHRGNAGSSAFPLHRRHYKVTLQQIANAGDLRLGAVLVRVHPHMRSRVATSTRHPRHTDETLTQIRRRLARGSLFQVGPKYRPSVPLSVRRRRTS